MPAWLIHSLPDRSLLSWKIFIPQFWLWSSFLVCALVNKPAFCPWPSVLPVCFLVIVGLWLRVIHLLWLTRQRSPDCDFPGMSVSCWIKPSACEPATGVHIPVGFLIPSVCPPLSGPSAPLPAGPSAWITMSSTWPYMVLLSCTEFIEVIDEGHYKCLVLLCPTPIRYKWPSGGSDLVPDFSL